MHPSRVEVTLYRFCGRYYAGGRVRDEIKPFSPFPPELLLKILRYLPQNDLRRASLASREFYGIALAAGLYILRKVEWFPSYSTHPGFGASLETLDRVVEYARTSRPSLNIAICAKFNIWKNETEATTDAVKRFLASVNHALPYLVRLEVVLPCYVPDTVYDLICAGSAPRLCGLSVAHEMSGPTIVPLDLFNRDAQHLRTLSLALATTEALRSWATVAALHRITHLTVSAHESPHRIALARLFPALRVLALDCPGTLDEGTIDLDGLRLDYLALMRGADCLTDRAALAAVPVVEQRDAVDVLSPTQWPAQLGAICAHAEEVPQRSAAVSFAPADGSASWRRTITLSGRDAALPLLEPPALASTLVSMTLGKSLVNAFLQAPVELVRLRELFLDVSAEGVYCWPPVDAFQLELRVHFDELPAARVLVKCPALARVVIFAVPSGHPVTVRPTKVTRLGRALSLGAPGPMPTLTLAGCTFHDPPIWPALNKLFVRVEFVECTGDRMPGYYRTCRYSSFFEDPEW